MKSTIALVLSLVTSSAMCMSGMPDGHYHGYGRWSDKLGQNGSYVVTSTIQANRIASTFSYNGRTKHYEMSIEPDINGQFSVFVSGHKMGTGYCKSVQCHYEISYGNTELEETFTFYQNNFYRIGSKRVNGNLVTWEESMTKQGD